MRKRFFCGCLLLLAAYFGYSQGGYKTDTLFCTAQRALYRYQLGMLFYFPIDSFLIKNTIEMAGYSLASRFVVNNSTDRIVTYNLLGGHYFRLEKVDTPMLRYSWGETHRRLLYILRDTASKGIVSFSFPADALQRSAAEESAKRPQSLSLTGAIFWGDIENCRTRILNQRFYSTFAIDSNGKKKKYQQVLITRVEAGTPEAPVRVYYRPAMGKEDHIDVVTCGTNVPPAFVDLLHFSALFQDESTVVKERTAAGDDWEAICLNDVRPGMQEKSMIFLLGQPKTITVKEEKGKKETHYVYKDKDIYVEKEIVTKIEMSGPPGS